VYNEKLKQAYIKANYVSKEKYKKMNIKPRRWHRGEVGYCFETLFLLNAFARP